MNLYDGDKEKATAHYERLLQEAQKISRRATPRSSRLYE